MRNCHGQSIVRIPPFHIETNAMSSEDLPALLRKLHVELERATTLDPESRELLDVLAHDLTRFESHMSTARTLAVRFEAEHPDVAGTLRQLTDALAKAGF